MNFNYYLSSYIKKNRTQLIRLKLETSQNDVQYLDSEISVKKTPKGATANFNLYPRLDVSRGFGDIRIIDFYDTGILVT